MGVSRQHDWGSLIGDISLMESGISCTLVLFKLESEPQFRVPQRRELRVG